MVRLVPDSDGTRRRDGGWSSPNERMTVVRRVTTILALFFVVGGAYAATPFLTLWQIREALRTGDVATL